MVFDYPGECWKLRLRKKKRGIRLFFVDSVFKKNTDLDTIPKEIL